MSVDYWPDVREYGALADGSSDDSVAFQRAIDYMDCEGSEMAYLQLEDYPGLYKATIIVEIHNLIGVPRTDETLKERFHPTHDIFNIYEGARNPNEIPLLLPTPSALRWMCVCENRPCCMNWFVMRPSHETSAARGEGSE